MTKEEFELTLFLMGFTKPGKSYYLKGSTVWLNQISHNTSNTSAYYKYEFIYPDHFNVKTLSKNVDKEYKQLHGYQRIINYLQRQELLIGSTND